MGWEVLKVVLSTMAAASLLLTSQETPHRASYVQVNCSLGERHLGNAVCLQLIRAPQYRFCKAVLAIPRNPQP